MGSCSDQESARSAQNAGLFVHFAGQRQGQFANVAGTLYAATGPLMPGTFSCWPRSPVGWSGF